jgi:pimeloyl-ACP methyl ester carboxylesterase
VLDLQAAFDPWRPADTRDGIRNDMGAKRVSVVVIADASHALIPEQPEAVVRAVRDWTRTI